MSEGLFQAREEATKDYHAGPEPPYVELLNLFSIEAFRILTLVLHCLFLQFLASATTGWPIQPRSLH